MRIVHVFQRCISSHQYHVFSMLCEKMPKRITTSAGEEMRRLALKLLSIHFKFTHVVGGMHSTLHPVCSVKHSQIE